MIKQRRCMGCNKRTDKAALLRVATDENGDFTLDAVQKLQSRGAYVCKSVACIEKAAKSRRIDRKLGHPLPTQLYAILKEAADGN